MVAPIIIVFLKLSLKKVLCSKNLYMIYGISNCPIIVLAHLTTLKPPKVHDNPCTISYIFSCAPGLQPGTK